MPEITYVPPTGWVGALDKVAGEETIAPFWAEPGVHPGPDAMIIALAAGLSLGGDLIPDITGVRQSAITVLSACDCIDRFREGGPAAVQALYEATRRDDDPLTPAELLAAAKEQYARSRDTRRQAMRLLGELFTAAGRDGTPTDGTPPAADTPAESAPATTPAGD